MIIRHWKGIVKREMETVYVNHLLGSTFPKLRLLKGFQGASIMKRSVSEGEEFLVITKWDSINSIIAFAGEKIEVAVVPEEAAICMVTFDANATHYEVLEEFK